MRLSKMCGKGSPRFFFSTKRRKISLIPHGSNYHSFRKHLLVHPKLTHGLLAYWSSKRWQNSKELARKQTIFATVNLLCSLRRIILHVFRWPTLDILGPCCESWRSAVQSSGQTCVAQWLQIWNDMSLNATCALISWQMELHLKSTLLYLAVAYPKCFRQTALSLKRALACTSSQERPIPFS